MYTLPATSNTAKASPRDLGGSAQLPISRHRRASHATLPRGDCDGCVSSRPGISVMSSFIRFDSKIARFGVYPPFCAELKAPLASQHQWTGVVLPAPKTPRGEAFLRQADRTNPSGADLHLALIISKSRFISCDCFASVVVQSSYSYNLEEVGVQSPRHAFPATGERFPSPEDESGVRGGALGRRVLRTALDAGDGGCVGRVVFPCGGEDFVRIGR